MTAGWRKPRRCTATWFMARTALAKLEALALLTRSTRTTRQHFRTSRNALFRRAPLARRARRRSRVAELKPDLRSTLDAVLTRAAQCEPPEAQRPLLVEYRAQC